VVSSEGNILTRKGLIAMLVPVVDQSQRPLMPTTPSRARRWIKGGKATAFWKGGIFCVRLNAEPSARVVQPLAVGIDPGAKREGYSVLPAAHTYLNIQAQAREGVKDAERDSTRMRRTRRNRKTPCRKPRQNRKQIQPEKGGKRKPYGGTLSCGIKRGTLVMHPKWGKATVGGTMDGKLSLHDPSTNRRLTQSAKVMDCKPLRVLRWRTNLVPLASIPASSAPKKERFFPPLAEALGSPEAEVR
jgi:hypothetical protein